MLKKGIQEKKKNKTRATEKNLIKKHEQVDNYFCWIKPRKQ